MKAHHLLLAALAAAPTISHATVPAVPSLTAGAEFKGLQFDWEPVTGATWYQLELRAHRIGDFIQQGDDFSASITSTRITFPLHWFDWTYARYRLAACNSSGCSYSTEVPVSNLRLDAVGYFKTYLTDYNHHFGRSVDISSGGLNFAASAPGEPIYSGTTQNVGGAVYVYGKAAGGWQRRARLQPTVAPYPGDPNDIEDHQEMHVSISGDGNMVALGKPYYFKEEFDGTAGEVWTFRFNGSSWVRTRIPRPATGYTFGSWVSLSDAGDLLAVGTGGTLVDVYRLANGAWQHVRSIDDSDPAGGSDTCDNGAFSLDGSTIVQACYSGASSQTRNFLRVFSGSSWQTRTEIPLQLPVKSGSGYYFHWGIDLDRTGATIATQVAIPPGILGNEADDSEVHVFHRSGAGAYGRVAVLKAGAWRTSQHTFHFGLGLAVSGDGTTIAVADPADNGLGTGPRAAPLNRGDNETGGAYIFRLKDSWVLANMVKPNAFNRSGVVWGFGMNLKLSDNGKTLIIGDDGQNSLATGVGGSWHNEDRLGSGAVWMY